MVSHNSHNNNIICLFVKILKKVPFFKIVINFCLYEKYRYLEFVKVGNPNAPDRDSDVLHDRSVFTVFSFIAMFLATKSVIVIHRHRGTMRTNELEHH